MVAHDLNNVTLPINCWLFFFKWLRIFGIPGKEYLPKLHVFLVAAADVFLD